jgi:hypothetical protein
VAAAYALCAWDRLLVPSPQFHFVDLAYTLMHGRVDTNTPKERATPAKPDDPPGYRAAIQRTLDAGGWNDWAAIRTIHLREPVTAPDGSVVEVVRGRFPWADAQSGDEKKHLFWTTGGLELKIQVPQDVARSCGEDGQRLCDETHHYVSFPPFPALPMMPFVAVWGYATNDVILTIAFGALNAVLLFLLLELLVARGHSARTRPENLWLVLMFAVGSVAFFSSVRGEIWFTALIVGITLNLCFMLAALDARHPLVAGVALACAVATRAPLAFAVVFFAWQLCFPGNRFERGRIKEILVKGTLFAVPVVAMAVTLAAYNQVRFDAYGEFGHSYLAGGAGERIRDHGLFSGHFLNLNLSALLTNLPRLSAEAPFFHITKHGLSLVCTTPALALVLWPRAKPPLRIACWLAIAAVGIPGVFYQNTGWEQFGYRFALDYLPYLVALLAMGGRPMTWRVMALILVGIALNLLGAISFGRFQAFYY